MRHTSRFFIDTHYYQQRITTGLTIWHHVVIHAALLIITLISYLNT